MPTRVSRNSSTEMEQEYSRNLQSRLPAAMEDSNAVHNESGSNHSHRQIRKSPPPLIPNSGYSAQKLSENMSCDNRANDGSAFMMQFMTAAAAAAMVAASKKCDTQARTAEPHSSSNMYESATSSNRRPSSSLSTGPNASPSSTSSSCRSLSGHEGNRIGSTSRFENYRNFGDPQKSMSITPEKTNLDDDINIVQEETNKHSSKRSGYSLPLPPGAVPVGTLPHPPLPNASAQRYYDGMTGSSRRLSNEGVAIRPNMPRSNKGSGNGYTSNKTPIVPIRGPPVPLALLPPPHTWPMFAAIPTINGNIMARNHNGSVSVTTQPGNESELQLYRVLQRANLLSYFDTFIAQGGDDVHQLCEAGEAEFLEIMALVGMASKPLHVRRLQKALQEWVQNPALFQAPLTPLTNFPPTAPPTGANKSSESINAIDSTLPVGMPGIRPASATLSGDITPNSSRTNNISDSPVWPTPQGGVAAQPNVPGATNLITASQEGRILISPLSSTSTSVGSLIPTNNTSTPSIVPAVSSSISSGISPAMPSLAIASHFSLASPMNTLKVGEPTSLILAHANENNSSASIFNRQQPSSSGLSSSNNIQPSSPSPAGSINSSTSIASSTQNASHTMHSGLSNHGRGTSPVNSQGINEMCTGGSYPPCSTSPSLQLTPDLVDSQIQRIVETATALIKSLPPPTADAKQPNHNKKKVSKEVELVMAMPDEDPQKIKEIRRFSAIYGRFDAKRKPEKPLTLHEVSVNEAAAQLCLLMPSLLNRRDELFPLARQVVRNSGYQYSKGHSRSQFCQTGFPSKLFGTNVNIKPDKMNSGSSGDTESGESGKEEGGSEDGKKDRRSSDTDNSDQRKRHRTTSVENEELIQRRKERIQAIYDEIRHIRNRSQELNTAHLHARASNDVKTLHTISQQLEFMNVRYNKLIQEQREHDRIIQQQASELTSSAISSRSGGNRVSTSSEVEKRRSLGRSNTGGENNPNDTASDEDSQLSYSTTGSPVPNANLHAESSSISNQTKSPSSGKVISSSGGQIIAVQNPALAMSESLSIKTTIQSKSGSSSPLSKTKKDDSGLNSIGPVSSSLISERQTAKSNSLHLPHLQQGSPSLYRNAYALNNPSLIENPSAVATLLNLSRRGSGRQSAAATYSDTLNSTQDKNSTLGGISSDRESPSSSSSTACTTSSGYPRPKRSKRSENNDDSETNEELESGAMTKVQKMDKDKEDCDIDENFLGEVKQEPMSPQGVSPPRSDPSTMEASFSSNSNSHSSAPLTRHSARTKLKNE